jgi:hypothetical protein
MHSLLKTLVCSLALLASGQSFALYRCGSVFQDRPCDITDAQAAAATNARAGAKPPADSTAAAPAGTVSPFAMACSRVGKSSLDIIWKREAGALREAQYANAEGNPEHKNLVDAVYEQRGTAPQIRAAIEADCIGEKQRAADANAALAAVQKSQGTTAAPARTAPATGAGTGPLTVAGAPAKPNDSAAQCANLSSQLAGVQERARKGGGVAAMEQLANERRAIDSKISAAKC